eukprot:7122807-Prymnesium_polylepis.1
MHFRVCESHLLRQAASRRLVRVEYIVNPALIRQFEQQSHQFQRNGTPTDMLLAFHANRDRTAIDRIVRDNFDPRRLGSATGAGWYGNGFYFSEFPEVSLGYGGNMLLCRLLPGRVYDVPQQHNAPVPELHGQPLRRGYDSHRVRAHRHGYADELVMRSEKQILPCYILHME